MSYTSYFSKTLIGRNFQTRVITLQSCCFFSSESRTLIDFKYSSQLGLIYREVAAATFQDTESILNWNRTEKAGIGIDVLMAKFQQILSLSSFSSVELKKGNICH